MRAFGLAFAGFVVACLAVVGCAVTAANEGASSDAVTDGTGLPCAVADVLERNCQGCHASPPVYGAPMPLTTWDDLQAQSHFVSSKKVFEQMAKRIHATSRPMPPSGPMSAADLAVIDAWIAAGTPKSTESCSAPPAPDAGADANTLGCEPDQVLQPPTKWTAANDVTDEYVCYGIDIPNAQKRQAIAIAPRVDNKTVLHHMDLFQADESYGPEPRACSPFASSKWRMMFAWAPGGKDMILPPEAGFPLEGTTHYVVQIHYANPSHALGQQDGSGFALCTTDQLRPNDADVMAFGSDHFTVPPLANYSLDCSSPNPAGGDIHLFGMMPHLHNYGTSLTASLVPAGGEPTELAKQSHWDINNQAWFSIDTVVHAGDAIQTSCTWTNTTDHAISYGDSSADEMCYAFTMYYPRITASDWQWAQPAKTAQCKTPPPPGDDSTH